MSHMTFALQLHKGKYECVSFHILETGFCFSTSGGSTGGHVTPPPVSASLYNLDLRVFGAKKFGNFSIAKFTGRLKMEPFAVLKPRAPRKVCFCGGNCTGGNCDSQQEGGLASSRGGVRSPPSSLFSATPPPG